MVRDIGEEGSGRCEAGMHVDGCTEFLGGELAGDL